MVLKPFQLDNYRYVKDEVRPDVWCVSIVNHFRASFGHPFLEQGRSESKRHLDKKYERWCYWREKGFYVVTEAILKNGLRPDLIVFNENEIFIEEIVESESEASILRKKKDYPFLVFSIDA